VKAKEHLQQKTRKNKKEGRIDKSSEMHISNLLSATLILLKTELSSTIET